MSTEGTHPKSTAQAAATGPTDDDLAALREAAAVEPEAPTPPPATPQGDAPAAQNPPTSAPAPTQPKVDAPELPDFGGRGGMSVDTKRISMLSDVNLNVKIELGRTSMLIEDVLRLGEGSVVELDKLAGDPVDVLANERLIARGEVLVLNDSFCVRINEVFEADPHRISE